MYTACWAPDSDHVLYAVGKNLVLKPLQSGLKPTQWPAHEGLVLCVEWSHANNLIVSGGEDRKYKVLEALLALALALALALILTLVLLSRAGLGWLWAESVQLVPA